MRVSKSKGLGVALLVCALVLGGLHTFARQVGSLDFTRPELTATARLVAQEPDHVLPERFLVIDQGCTLLGPNGEVKERLESITYAAGAISPDGRWVAFTKSEPNPTPDKLQGKLIIQSRVRPDELLTVPLVWGASGSSWFSTVVRLFST